MNDLCFNITLRPDVWVFFWQRQKNILYMKFQWKSASLYMHGINPTEPDVNPRRSSLCWNTFRPVTGDWKKSTMSTVRTHIGASVAELASALWPRSLSPGRALWVQSSSCRLPLRPFCGWSLVSTVRILPTIILAAVVEVRCFRERCTSDCCLAQYSRIFHLY